MIWLHQVNILEHKIHKAIRCRIILQIFTRDPSSLDGSTSRCKHETPVAFWYDVNFCEFASCLISKKISAFNNVAMGLALSSLS